MSTSPGAARSVVDGPVTASTVRGCRHDRRVGSGSMPTDLHPDHRRRDPRHVRLARRPVRRVHVDQPAGPRPRPRGADRGGRPLGRRRPGARWPTCSRSTRVIGVAQQRGVRPRAGRRDHRRLRGAAHAHPRHPDRLDGAADRSPTPRRRSTATTSTRRPRRSAPSCGRWAAPRSSDVSTTDGVAPPVLADTEAFDMAVDRRRRRLPHLRRPLPRPRRRRACRSST